MPSLHYQVVDPSPSPSPSPSSSPPPPSSSSSELNMFQHLHSHILLFLFYILWSCIILDCIVSDPQIHLLSAQCNPPDFFLVSNSLILTQNLNATFQDIRGQIRDQNKHFATAQQGSGENFPVYTLFQCRNYLSTSDCAACFEVAASEIRKCAAAASPSPGANAIYDGCFIRYHLFTTFEHKSLLCLFCVS